MRRMALIIPYCSLYIVSGSASRSEEFAHSTTSQVSQGLHHPVDEEGQQDPMIPDIDDPQVFEDLFLFR